MYNHQAINPMSIGLMVSKKKYLHRMQACYLPAFQETKWQGTQGKKALNFKGYLEIITNVDLHPLYTCHKCSVVLLKFFLVFAFHIKECVCCNSTLKWGPDRMNSVLKNGGNALWLHTCTIHFLHFFFFIQGLQNAFQATILSAAANWALKIWK